MEDLPNPARSVFEHEHRVLTEGFKSTQAIANPTDRGVARELLLADAIGRHLPTKYGIGRGQVIDASGWVSKQQDLIIFDSLNAPVLHTSPATQSYPRESVLALIQVKSRLKPADIETTVNQIAEVCGRPLSPSEILPQGLDQEETGK